MPSRRFALFALLLLAAVALPVATVQADSSDKWRIHVKNDAEGDGVVTFQFKPRGGYPFEVAVSVAAGTEENDVARRIRDVFQAELPQDAYEVEVDSGEEVVVEADKRTGEFMVTLLNSSIAGVELEVERQ
jgi:hypothetical protein